MKSSSTDKQQRRRVNPVAQCAGGAVILLMLFQLLVIAGALELKAHTVARYAPWAYEPFLRLVGEHPDSAPRWAAVEEAEGQDAASSVADVAGLEPSAIPILIDTNQTSTASNETIEVASPLESEPAPAEPTRVPAAAEPVG